jgi:hypothetical protein
LKWFDLFGGSFPLFLILVTLDTLVQFGHCVAGLTYLTVKDVAHYQFLPVAGRLSVSKD